MTVKYRKFSNELFAERMPPCYSCPYLEFCKANKVQCKLFFYYVSSLRLRPEEFGGVLVDVDAEGGMEDSITWKELKKHHSVTEVPRVSAWKW